MIIKIEHKLLNKICALILILFLLFFMLIILSALINNTQLKDFATKLFMQTMAVTLLLVFLTKPYKDYGEYSDGTKAIEYT